MTFKNFLWVFYGCCVGVIGLEFALSLHPHYVWETPGFYAVFGFVSVSALVLVSKYILRPLVKRKESYYDE